MFCAIALVALVAALVIVLERGLVDGVIENRARVAMAQALGDAYTSEIGGAGVRVTSRGEFALIARDVSIKPAGEAGGAYAVNRLRLILDPLALATGRIQVNSIGVDGARLIAGVGPGFGFSDLGHFRVDSLDQRIEQAFEGGAGRPLAARRYSQGIAGRLRLRRPRAPGHGSRNARGYRGLGHPRDT